MIYWFTGQPSHGKTVLANLFKKSHLLLGDDLVEIYIHTSEPRERDHFRSDAYVSPKENFIDIDTTIDTPEESLQRIITELGW